MVTGCSGLEIPYFCLREVGKEYGFNSVLRASAETSSDLRAHIRRNFRSYLAAFKKA